MKIVLAAGTGQVGSILLRHWIRTGHECVLLTRNPERTHARLNAACALPGSVVRPIKVVGWDARTLGPWINEIDGADVIVNLAGRSVNCRYTEKNLARMMTSRTETTRLIGNAIVLAKRPPVLWLQAGTATIYSHRYDAPNDELTGIIGGNEPGVPALWKRSVDIALAWEEALNEAPTPATRKVSLRAAMVMSPDSGGVFSAFASLASIGMGAQGNGSQWVSWIHEADFAEALDFIIAEKNLSGAINLCAPAPLPNRDFIHALHVAIGKPFSVRAPKWLLELGAFFHRTETELLLKSRRVIPTRLTNAGFVFKFPTWPEAARDLAVRWRR